MSAVEEGYFHDRGKGVTISVLPIDVNGMSHPHRELLREGNGLAVQIENNWRNLSPTHGRIQAAAKNRLDIAVLHKDSVTYVWGSKESVLDFLTPLQKEGQSFDDWDESALLDVDHRVDLEDLYNWRLKQQQVRGA